MLCATSNIDNILTTKKDQITRGDIKESWTRRIQWFLLENLVLAKKSNQQTKKWEQKRITSSKRTTKEKKTTPFFTKPGRRAVHRMS